MKPKILIFCILIIAFSACKKQVEKERPEFIGDWYACIGGCDYFVILKINENSEASYMIYWQGKDTNYYGVARANNKHFKIGRTKYFDIVEYPHKIDTVIEKKYVLNTKGVLKLANWKMVLDGMKPSWLHVSGTYTYYKSDY